MEHTHFPKSRWYIFAAVAFAWFTFGALFISVAPLLELIGKEFGREVGTLTIDTVALCSVALSVGVIVSGPLIDRFGPRRLLLVSACMMTVYCILVSVLGHSVFAVVVLRLFLGLSAGPVFACMAACSNQWFPPQEQGAFNGVGTASMSLGFAAAFVGIPILLQQLDGDWRKLIGISAVIPATLVVLLLFALLIKEPREELTSARGGEEGGEFSIALKLPVFWFGAFLIAVASATVQSFNALAPTYLTSARPLGLAFDPMLSGRTMSLVQFGTIAGGMSLGPIMQKLFHGSTRVMSVLGAVLCGGAVFASLLPVIQHSVTGISLLFFLTGMFNSYLVPAASVYIAANYPPGILGKVFATSMGIASITGAIVVAITGAVLDKAHSFLAVFLLLFALGIVGGIAGILLKPIPTSAFDRFRTLAYV